MEHGGSSNAASSTRIISVGIDAAALDGHDADLLALPADAASEDVFALADELDTDALAILPAVRQEPALRRLQVLQSALDGRCRIAACVTTASPLAASVLVRLAASAATAMPAGLLADALPALEQELLVAAVVPSVLRLRDPAPPFGARVRSLLPGARYLVTPEPEPAVVTLHGGHAVPRLLDDPTDEVAVVAAGRLRGAGDAHALLAELFGGAKVSQTEAPAGIATRWRAAQALEAVAYPTDPEQMIRRLMAIGATSCPWCAAPHAALPCALCGHDRDQAISGERVAA